MSFQIESIPYAGWKNCLRLRHAHLELVATTEVGPRIIHFGAQGKGNELYTRSADLGRKGGKAWRMYGGHRLWTAPESAPYAPDNDPVRVEFRESGVRLNQAPEAKTRLQKTVEISPLPGKPGFSILHRIRNRSRRTQRLAPWALTVLKAGGHAEFEIPPRAPFPKKLRPEGCLALWPYTDLSDKRWSFKSDRLRFHANPRNSNPQKIGAWIPQGRASYVRHGRRFTKLFGARAGGEYPDGGVNFELFGQGGFVELESLGVLQDLRPGKSLEHEEIWLLA